MVERPQGEGKRPRRRALKARGVDLLHDPAVNKGSAFTATERAALGLRGLLPPKVFTQEEQARRILSNLRSKSDDLERYVQLIELQDRNEALFYWVVINHLEEVMPLIYTPTVGRACRAYGHIFRRPRGIFISLEDRGSVAEVLKNWPRRQVRIIVVTDGERILGLGDLGANGMGIPVGKLSLYVACGGIHPAVCLPVTLDVGTNNAPFLNDPLYIGLRRERVRGEDYDALVEEFITAVDDLFPGAVVQFEDFANANALRLLQKYRGRVCAFNDDIQGTASVVLAGLISAGRITGRRLAEQKLLFLGAGTAGIGIGELFAGALKAEGVVEADARRQCWFFDRAGLLVRSRRDVSAERIPFAHDHPPAATFLEAIEALEPTAIVGVSGQPGLFTQEVIEAMARRNDRPIIFALSNPTSNAECSAEDAYRWSGGRAIFAGGSPFPPVEIDGNRLVPGQGNNAYIFPGVGLGLLATEARHATDEMFRAAAFALAEAVTEEDLARGTIYPPLSAIREVSVSIAKAVAEVVYVQELTGEPRPANLEEHIRSNMYWPDYPTYA